MARSARCLRAARCQRYAGQTITDATLRVMRQQAAADEVHGGAHVHSTFAVASPMASSINSRGDNLHSLDSHRLPRDNAFHAAIVSVWLWV